MTRSTRRTAGPEVGIHPLIRYALYAFVCSIPLEYPGRTIPIEVHTITAGLLLGAAMMQPRACFRVPDAAFWWLAAFVWLYAARAMFAEHPSEAARQLANLVLVTLVFWVAQNLMRDRRVARAALWSFVAGCAVIAALQSLDIGTTTVLEQSMGSVRVTVFGQDENLLGANMVVAMLVVVALVASRIRAAGAEGGQVPVLLVALALGTLALLGKAVLLSGSRGAVIAAAAGMFMLPLRPGRGLRGTARIVGGALVVLALAAVAVNKGPVANRFHVAEQGNLAGREYLFPEAWDMFLQKPVLGWGPGDNLYELGDRTFAVFGRRSSDLNAAPYRDPHNLLLELLTATGIVGAIPFLACLVLCVRMAWRARAGPHATLPLALIAASIVIAMDVPWLLTKQLWLVCAYAVAAGGEHARAVRRVAVPDVLGNVHRPGDARADSPRDRRAHPVPQAAVGTAGPARSGRAA